MMASGGSSRAVAIAASASFSPTATDEPGNQRDKHDELPVEVTDQRPLDDLIPAAALYAARGGGMGGSDDVFPLL